jgi:outer membrane protein
MNRPETQSVSWRRPFVLAFAALALLIGLGAADEPVKIGTVDMELAITSTDEGKRINDEMKRKQRDAEGKLQPMIDRYQEAAKELDSKRFVLSDEALREKQLDLLEQRNSIEASQQEAKRKLEIDLERMIGPMRKKMGEIVEEIGREGGFSLIMVRSMPGLMYTREALDITDLVIERFNKKKS